MENNNGKGIFYGVIGVATLVVAIIGATTEAAVVIETAPDPCATRSNTAIKNGNKNKNYKECKYWYLTSIRFTFR